MSNPDYSFAPDASTEFQRYINELSKSMGKHIDTTLKLSSLGSDDTIAFNCVRDGDVVHLMYPQNVKQGDLLAAVITAIASSIPTCIVHESSAGWSEPEWTPECRKHLGGLLVGLEGAPQSFAHTSSPSDLARISLWLTTCAAALSRPGGVADAHGDVLPTSIGGQKSASKYMLKVISGLRSAVNDEACLKAIETLSTLIKLWQKNRYDESLSIVRKCKLAWSSVLFRAAPTEIIKGKKNRPDQTIIRSPPKPSRSPWLSPAERSELGNLFKDKWSFLEGYRKRWQALIPEQQHRQMNTFIRDIKHEYEMLNSLSNSLHSKLGKRKYWIERVCRQDSFKPKPKKNESESFLLSAHFFKKDLSSLSISVKKTFSPYAYLDEHTFRSSTIFDELLVGAESDINRISAGDFSEADGPAWRLWQIWAELFHPVLQPKQVKVEDPQPIDSYNMYTILEAKAPG